MGGIVIKKKRIRSPVFLFKYLALFAGIDPRYLRHVLRVREKKCHL